MAWWPFRTSSPTHRHDDGADGDGGGDRAELEAAVASLRGLLRSERHRLRPDARTTAWAITERAGEYAPSWGRLSSQRPAETQELVLFLSRRLEPLLRDFLALPDSQKPAHADELQTQLGALESEADRLGRRLTRALSSRLRARGEL